MNTPQTIVIIGTSAKGKAIARSLADGNYRVLLCSDDAEEANRFVYELKVNQPAFDIESSHCSYEATWEADIIILAVPDEQQESLLHKIKAVANQKVIIATGCTSKELQTLLPHSKVVEAFNANEPNDFIISRDQKYNTECIITGNNEEALQVAAELVSTIGFKAVLMQTQGSR